MTKITHSVEIPKWLSIGMRGADMPEGMSAEAKVKLLEELGVNARVLKRFTQLVRFVRENYPEAFLDPLKFIKAKSSAVEELLMLHGLSPEKANQIAHECLKGNFKMLEIRQLSAVERTKGSSNGSPLLRAKIASKAFEQVATDYLLSRPDIFYEIGGKEVNLVRTKSSQAPNLEISTLKGKIAVEIKAPSKHPLSIEGKQIAKLIDRLGVLQMRYCGVVLILPESNNELCKKLAYELAEWITGTTEKIKPVYALFLPETSTRSEDTGKKNQPNLKTII